MLPTWSVILGKVIMLAEMNQSCRRGTRLGGGAVRGCVGGCGSMSRGCVQVDVQVQVCGQCL